MTTGAGVLALSGCATAQMHTEAELALVGQRCGLAAGELFQDPSEKRLLFLFRIAPTPAEELCVARWARKNHMHPVFVEAINEPPN
jgi:hypothetical protein